MFWIILFGIAGCVVGTLTSQKRGLESNISLISGIMGCLVGLAVCAVCEFSLAIPEAAYVSTDIDSHKIAVTDENEIIYLDVRVDKGEKCIYYMSPDGRLRDLNYSDVEVEYVDSDFRVTHTKTQLTGWHSWLTLTKPEYKTTIYVPRELWVRKLPAR